VHRTEVDRLVNALQEKKTDQYKVLAQYASYIASQGKSADRIRKLVQTARLCFEFHGIEYSPRLFKQRVKMPRAIKREKHATDKQEITHTIQTCHDPTLQLALFWHASTGRRPEEIFSLRHCDLEFEKQPAEFHIRGEYTKMGVEQARPMSDELAARTKRYLAWKHRRRTITQVTGVRKDGTRITQTIDVQPQVRPNDLLFAEYRRDDTHVEAKPHNLYEWFSVKLGRHVDSIGKGARNGSQPRAPRKFTFYRLRDFVKTTVSDLGYSDYAEWLIGHSGSTYYSQTKQKQVEMYRKVEQYLTFLDIAGLEAKQNDVSTKLESMEKDLLEERIARQRLELRLENEEGNFRDLLLAIAEGKLTPQQLSLLILSKTPSLGGWASAEAKQEG
jgi:hypothetical protein